VLPEAFKALSLQLFTAPVAKPLTGTASDERSTAAPAHQRVSFSFHDVM